MNRKIVITCASMLALAGSFSAVAGNRPGVVTFSIADAYYHFANKRHLNNINMPNLGLAYNFDEHWAMEADVGLINTQSNKSKHNFVINFESESGLNTNFTEPTPGQSVHGFLYTLDAMYRFLPSRRFEPFVSAGVGVISLKPNGHDAKQQGNINAGIGTQFFISDSLALRIDARDVYTTTGGKNDFMINLGLNFLLTVQPQPAPVLASYKGENLLLQGEENYRKIKVNNTAKPYQKKQNHQKLKPQQKANNCKTWKPKIKEYSQVKPAAKEHHKVQKYKVSHKSKLHHNGEHHKVKSKVHHHEVKHHYIIKPYEPNATKSQAKQHVQKKQIKNGNQPKNKIPQNETNPVMMQPVNTPQPINKAKPISDVNPNNPTEITPINKF